MKSRVHIFGFLFDKKMFVYFSYGYLVLFFKWFWYFTAMTSLRLKIVKPHILFSLIITLGVAVFWPR